MGFKGDTINHISKVVYVLAFIAFAFCLFRYGRYATEAYYLTAWVSGLTMAFSAIVGYVARTYY